MSDRIPDPLAAYLLGIAPAAYIGFGKATAFLPDGGDFAFLDLWYGGGKFWQTVTVELTPDRRREARRIREAEGR